MRDVDSLSHFAGLADVSNGMRDATGGSEGPRDAWTSRAFTTTSNAHGSSMMKTTRNQ